MVGHCKFSVTLIGGFVLFQDSQPATGDPLHRQWNSSLHLIFQDEGTGKATDPRESNVTKGVYKVYFVGTDIIAWQVKRFCMRV